MIIMKIAGGLGNQLFQYAVGRSVSNHHQVPLKLDINSYENYKLHNGYRLGQFNIKSEIATEDEIYELKGSNSPFYRIAKRVGFVKNMAYYAEKERTIYDPDVFKNNSRYLDGYWQNEQYFAAIRADLLKELTPKEALSLEAQEFQIKMQSFQKNNAVSIHVRRGDYLNHPEIGVLDIEYYKQAVAYIKSKVESPMFFIFSDDLDWCKDNFRFIDSPILVEDSKTEIDDLILMSKCKHNIVANSSFSWWAAWLNSSLDKIIISPKNWMRVNPKNHKWVPDKWLQF